MINIDDDTSLGFLSPESLSAEVVLPPEASYRSAIFLGQNELCHDLELTT